MSLPSTVWEQLDTELIPRLSAVGFSATEYPAATPAELSRVTYTAFVAPYALLFCARIPSDDPQQIVIATSFACDTMRAALVKAEANDWTRDGYVIAAIASPPKTGAVAQILRTFEQGRSICRRHVVWPETDAVSNDLVSWTSKLDRVTVLALPEPETAAARHEVSAPIPWYVEHVHNRLVSGATYTEIAEELVAAARERKQIDAS